MAGMLHPRIVSVYQVFPYTVYTPYTVWRKLLILNQI